MFSIRIGHRDDVEDDILREAAYAARAAGVEAGQVDPKAAALAVIDAYLAPPSSGCAAPPRRDDAVLRLLWQESARGGEVDRRSQEQRVHLRRVRLAVRGDHRRQVGVARADRRGGRQPSQPHPGLRRRGA